MFVPNLPGYKARRHDAAHIVLSLMMVTHGDESKDLLQKNGIPLSMDKFKRHTTYVAPPYVDKPWSFVVALASFSAQGLLGGYVYTGGIFYHTYKAEFPDISTVAISWVCALPLTLWFIGSPIGSAITNRYNCRTCALIGGVLSTLGLSLCYFATSFYMILICYGLIAGFGFGIMYVAFVTAVSQYFVRFRTSVTILSTIGPMFGMSLYSFLVPYLMYTYSWRGALLILGGMSFNLCCCACALFPQETKQVSRRSFNVMILKQTNFFLLCLQCFAAIVANAMVVVHLPALILSMGLGSSVGSISLTVYGVSNCVAKMLYSFFGHVTNADVSTVYTLSLVVCGCAMGIVPVLTNIHWVLCCVGVVGFSYCVTGGHILMVILEFVGTDKFSDGVGVNQIFKAGGSLVAGPLAGVLYHATGDYTTSFYVSGVTMVTGCACLIPTLVSKYRNRNKRIQGDELIVS